MLSGPPFSLFTRIFREEEIGAEAEILNVVKRALYRAYGENSFNIFLENYFVILRLSNLAGSLNLIIEKLSDDHGKIFKVKHKLLLMMGKRRRVEIEQVPPAERR